MTKKRIFITGASGFIGKHLVAQAMNKGMECVNYDKVEPDVSCQKVCWQQGDILDLNRMRELMKGFQPDYVVHLAARTDLDGNSSEDYRENTDGTRNVLMAAANAGSVKRVIVASTMYVVQRGYVATADDDYSVSTIYGDSKVETEEITRRGDWPFDWVIVRPAVIWGPYHERMKREFFKMLSLGLYFHPGGRRTRRSYGYVENTAWQMLALLDCGYDVASKTYYLADKPIDLYDWVNECSIKMRGKPVKCFPVGLLKPVAVLGDILKQVGVTFPLTSFRLANITSDWTVDVDSLESVVGDVPIDMKTGVERTVKWVKYDRF